MNNCFIDGKVIEEAMAKLGTREKPADNTAMKVMQAWGLLHGIISLYHSNIAQYIVADPLQVVNRIMDDIATLLSPIPDSI